jgi:peroxiredoxin/YHS domain-containing protein
MRYPLLTLLFLLLTFTPALAGDEACAVCSVEQQRYHLESCKLSTSFEGKDYHFCQRACLQKFQQNPSQWAAKFGALDTEVKTSAMLPAFRFPLEPLGSLSSQDLQGKVLVLNLWATWCGPCKEEMPDLVRLQDQYRDRGVTVVALSFDRTKEAHRKGVAELGLNFPSIYADQPAVQEFLDKLGQVSAIPVTFIVDTEGRIVKRIEGKTELSKLVEEIEPLLGF